MSFEGFPRVGHMRQRTPSLALGNYNTLAVAGDVSAGAGRDHSQDLRRASWDAGPWLGRRNLGEVIALSEPGSFPTPVLHPEENYYYVAPSGFPFNQEIVRRPFFRIAQPSFDDIEISWPSYVSSMIMTPKPGGGYRLWVSHFDDG